MKERLASLKTGPSSLTADPEKGGFGVKKDYIASFLEAKKLHPDVVTDENIVMYILTNVSFGSLRIKKLKELIRHQISAGADPTATVQKAIIYHLLRNPSALDKLRAELDSNQLSFPPSYEETRNSSKLPYLNAVIKEGLRMHPTVGLVLERIGP